MSKIWSACLLIASLALPTLPALADSYSDTIGLFKNAGASAAFFGSSYGYAVFPTIGKGGLLVGAAHGAAQVYQKGGGKKDATTAGNYQKGVAVFTIAKGGLMYQAAVAGQKFSYKALASN